jgi:hypothetical protein
MWAAGLIFGLLIERDCGTLEKSHRCDGRNK